MKCRKIVVSKMSARFLWMRLLSHTYDTAETVSIWSLLQELKKLLLPFDIRIKERLKQADDDETALMAAGEEIDGWAETWDQDVTLLMTPDAYEIVKERWKQIPKVNERGQQTGLEDARFAPQQGKVVIELIEAFDKAKEVDITEKETVDG